MTYSSKSNAIATTGAITDENARSEAASGLMVLRSSITAIVLFMLGLFLFFSAQLAEAQTKGIGGSGIFKSGEGSGPPTSGEFVHSPSFTKTGRQTSCGTVQYRLRFAIDADDPAAFDHPPYVAYMTAAEVTLEDVLPAGLSVIGASISGDVTDGAGGVPIAAISTTANPNDTVKFSNFKFSTADLDGDGALTTRSFEITITAEIDPAAFPAPIMVDNQGKLEFVNAGEDYTFLSHDPALPDDGDPQTGEPTSILIDLTDCDTPPGGGGTPEGEPCFKVERGEVECARDGGGALIYNMPVGPEMAGRSIELVSLTPGITIAPASQIVPPGGGVLSWTITGAAPGMTISLSVVGMELGAGPAEGWGLCCAQRIDIEIPEGIDCPPPPEREGEPDIEIKKRADVPRCTPEGGCDFTITARNVGDAPYTGKIAIDEITSPVGARLAGPPNAPWTCDSITAPMTCTHPSRTLNPGESVELKVSFVPGPDWNWREIRNCAEYDHAASGLPEPFGRLDNDKACASIPIVFPDPEQDPEKKVDLDLKKEHGGTACSPDGICYFFIYIKNVGTENFNGPLTFVDNYTTGAPLSAEFSPAPPWNCSTINPSQFRCESVGNISLPVGASTRIRVLTTIDPARVTGGSVENCATLDAVPGETNLDNQKDCSKIPVTTAENGEPKIEIEKVCRVDDPGSNSDHWTCKITVTNSGTAAPEGEISILEELQLLDGTTIPDMLLGATTGNLTCSGQGTAEVDCSVSGSELTPGTSVEMNVSFSLQAGHRFENCATVYEKEQGAEGGELGKSCVTGEKIKEEVQCTPPLVANANGRCVCPQGTKYRRGKCVGGENSTPPPPPPAPPVTKLCKRLPGQYRTEDNRCLCRRGTELNRSRTACVKTKPDLCTLKPGQIRTRKGQCVCPRGTTFSKRRDRCVKEQCTLKRGQIRTQNGQCICPRGTTFSKRRDRCVKEQCTLKRGQIRTQNGQCVCPRGTTFSKRRDRCVKEQCTLKRGQIRTQNGQCICPRGTTFSKRRDRCVKEQCTLKPGQIRTRKGQCVCPRGTTFSKRRDRCVKEQCTLKPGQIRTRKGQCVCPRGTTFSKRRDRCVKEQCTLKPGQIRTRKGQCVCPRGTKFNKRRNRCMSTEPPRCKLKRGQIRTKNGQCVCPRGTTFSKRRNRCVTIVVNCPKGYTGRPPKCRKIITEPRPCPRGTVRKGRRCVPARCPRGMTGTPPKCRKIIVQPKRCPTGFTGRPPNCRKVIRRPRPCRPGYIRKNGRCVADLI